MSPAIYDYLVQIPDKPDAFASRMSHLTAHLDYNKPQIQADKLVLSGPTLAHQPKDAEDKPAMTGSVLMFKAGSEEEVWEMVRGNPYSREGVWNLDQATITLFKCAVRKAL